MHKKSMEAAAHLEQVEGGEDLHEEERKMTMDLRRTAKQEKEEQMRKWSEDEKAKKKIGNSNMKGIDQFGNRSSQQQISQMISLEVQNMHKFMI